MDPQHDVEHGSDEQAQYQPWYRSRDYTEAPPFKLVRKISSQNEDAPSFRTLAIFPWSNGSLGTLWKGSLNTEDCIADWEKMISQYWDAVAVGSDYSLYVFFTHKMKAPLCVRLPQDNQRLIDADVMCVAWGLSHNAPFEPVIIFSRGSVAYVYSMVRGGMAGYVRGHGGAITSIAVHPTNAHLFCTTSRDQTTRIYDLTLLIIEAKLDSKRKDKGKKKQADGGDKVVNPHWPPSKLPSFAGAPHGLHLKPSEVEDEGRGVGRCVGVLMGGRSGGHNAAVLGAAFHSVYPIIATCGMDRCVKIWYAKPTSSLEIKREDKPIFTSSRIHKARVLSISWLRDDILLTYSAPAIMRKFPNTSDNKETYLEPGELIIWRWLGVDRFFPPGYEDVLPPILRGCSSDYQESCSFKLVSIHRFPDVSSQFITPKMSLFQSSTHDPLAMFIYPGAREFLMLNLCHLSPKRRPPFPLDLAKIKGRDKSAATAVTAGVALEDATKGLHIGQERPIPLEVAEDDGNVYVGEEETEVKVNDTQPILNGRELVPPPLDGWKMKVDEKTLMHCAMSMGGRVIVGVGSNSTLWVWNLVG